MDTGVHLSGVDGYRAGTGATEDYLVVVTAVVVTAVAIAVAFAVNFTVLDTVAVTATICVEQRRRNHSHLEEAGCIRS